MCGRFALYSPYPSLAASLRLPLEASEADLVPRYNVAPGTWISAVRRLDDEGYATSTTLAAWRQLKWPVGWGSCRQSDDPAFPPCNCR